MKNYYLRIACHYLLIIKVWIMEKVYCYKEKQKNIVYSSYQRGKYDMPELDGRDRDFINKVTVKLCVIHSF